jgi:hypothetical protein
MKGREGKGLEHKKREGSLTDAQGHPPELGRDTLDVRNRGQVI